MADELGAPLWIPLHAHQTAALARELSPVEWHAVTLLLVAAWTASERGYPPCTLPNDTDVIERLAGGVPYGVIAGAVARLFRTARTGYNLLECDFLLAQYEKVQTRRKQLAHAGRLGGRERGKRASCNTRQDRDLQASLKQTKKKVVPSSSQKKVLPAGALGLEAPRPAVADDPVSEGRRTLRDALAYLHAHPEVVHAPPPRP